MNRKGGNVLSQKIHLKDIPVHLRIYFIVAVVTLIHISFIFNHSLFISARQRITDTYFRVGLGQREALPHIRKIVVVGVDDESYRRLNRAWPWGRDVFAVFLENIEELNPKVIGLDFTFIGKSGDKRIDRWFGEALAKSNKVVLATYFSQEGVYMQPLEILKSSVLACGFVDKLLDSDYVIRRCRYMTQLEGPDPKIDVYSFGSEIALRFLGSGLRAPAPFIVMPNDFKRLPYRYDVTAFKYIPFWKFIAKKVPRSEIDGKIVLVGPVSAIFHDIHHTPLGLMPGIFINANEALSILDRDFLTDVLDSRTRPVFLFLLAAAVAAFFYRMPVLRQFLSWIMLELLLYEMGFYLLCRWNLVFEPLEPMWMVTVAYIVVVSYKSLSTFVENIQLQHLVVTDDLTGLYSHRYLTLRLKKEFDVAVQTRKELCFAMIDVDDFKQVNDNYGHEEGNTVLFSVAKRIRSGVRGMDVAARYGGEEFAILFLNSSLMHAAAAIERIRNAIASEIFHTPKGQFQVTISSGLCSNLSSDVKGEYDLVRLADQALYQAKSSGKNRLILHSPQTPA